jgi:alpha-galactosidase/6-phospho-beta-glucosidase family protein
MLFHAVCIIMTEIKTVKGELAMEIHGRQAQGLQVAYIGGGSRGWAWSFMTDLALDPQMEGEVRLYDIDRAAAERNEVIGRRIASHPGARSHWQYRTAATLGEALDGADFVVISILPGTFREMESDVHAPEAYGVYQSVGDTVGPGGFFRALRTIPMFAEIARGIREHCPGAWVINYTNPMTLCVRTLYEVFPKIKAFGCCHEVFGTQKLLAAMLKEELGAEDIPREEIEVNVLGINHFTWFDRASWRGTDLFPLYRRFVERYYETGYDEGQDDNWMNNSFACAHRVKFDLFRRYGLIAAAGDRHLAEFMPPWYLRDPDTVRGWMFGLTPVSWRVEDLQRRLQRSERLATGAEEVRLCGSGEEGHLLMKALLGLDRLVSNVNVPNRGQIANLPLGAVVETNALFRRDELSPVFAGNLPGDVLALVQRHVTNQENTLRAVMESDRRLALNAFLNDPLLARLTPAEGEALFCTMAENTRDYLPLWMFP